MTGRFGPIVLEPSEEPGASAAATRSPCFHKAVGAVARHVKAMELCETKKRHSQQDWATSSAL